MSSTYSNILGHNPYADWFLKHLGIPKQGFGRFRDVSLYNDGDGLYVIRVLTRNSGSRQKYQPYNQKLEGHPLFIRREDEPSDDTYLWFFFKMPLSMVDELAANNVDLDVAAASGDYWLVDNRGLKKIYEDAQDNTDDDPQTAEA